MQLINPVLDAAAQKNKQKKNQEASEAYGRTTYFPHIITDLI